MLSDWLGIAARLMFVTATLALLGSCSSESKDSASDPANGSSTNFPLPRQIVVSVAPYGSVDEALQDEQNIDWSRDTDAARAITLAYAARELRDHLALAGLQASYSSGVALGSEPAIILGIRNPGSPGTIAIPSEPSISYEALGDQGYLITPWQGRIYITANDRAGVLNGMYGFLDQLGFAWYDPYEILAPSPRSLDGPISWRAVQATPRVSLRGFWIYGDALIPDEFAIWLARNRLNIGGRAKPYLRHKLGLKGWGGEHDLLQQEFSRVGLFEQHPDWFALVDGVRQPVAASGTYFNPAFANTEAARYFADRMIERLEGGDLADIDILNVWPADDRFNRFDQSPEAVALGNESDNLLNFYAVLGERLREAFADGRLSRPVRIAGISYFLTMRPPSNGTVTSRLETSDYLHLFYLIERDWSGRFDTDLSNRDANRRILEDLTAWQSAADLDYGIVEYHNLSAYGALGLSDFPAFARTFGLLTRDRSALYAYMHPLLKNPGPRRLTNRLLARLAWIEVPSDPDSALLDDAGAALVREYFQRRYGEHAGEWQAIHELMAASVENAKEIFGTNSLDWLLLQELIWSVPHYPLAEAADLIARYRTGGAQDLPARFSGVDTIRATFRGLDESMQLQDEAARRWTALLDGPSLPADVRRRMQDDIEWFAATASRYRLMAATSDFIWARQHGLDLEEPRARIRRETDFLLSSAVLADTISPVDQRVYVDLHRRLAGIE